MAQRQRIGRGERSARPAASAPALRGKRWIAGAALAAAVAALAALPVRAQGLFTPPIHLAQGSELPPLQPPSVRAASAILMDAATGTVLWEKNARVRRPMASTTKIMTATLLLEQANLDDRVTFSARARATPYANLNAKPGEQFVMEDLLYAIMLRSSNDSCVAVAEHLFGSTAKFVAAMNRKARELGAADTHFVTPHGLHHPNHYSTAYDLAQITRYALQNPRFCEIVCTRRKVIRRSMNTKDVVLTNHNKFLSRYAGADGVKTGYVRQSGRCLVASATALEEGRPWRLIAVVLNSADTYGDSATLMDWGRRNFQPVFFARKGETLAVASVHGGSERSVPLVAAADLVAIVRRHPGKNPEREIRAETSLAAPVRSGQVGGRLVALVDGQPVGAVDLVSARPVSRVWLASMAPWTAWSMVLATLILGPRYARAFAKSARRRRRRLPTRRGGAHCRREGFGQRPGGHRTGYEGGPGAGPYHGGREAAPAGGEAAVPGAP